MVLVQVAFDEAGSDEKSACVDYPGDRAFRVADVSDRRDPIAFDCNVGVINLGGCHIDEPPSLDDNISWGFTHCNVDERSSLHIAILGRRATVQLTSIGAIGASKYHPARSASRCVNTTDAVKRNRQNDDRSHDQHLSIAVNAR